MYIPSLNRVEDPKSVNAHLAIANFYWSTGRRPEAEKALKDALALDPKNLLSNRIGSKTGRNVLHQRKYRTVLGKILEPDLGLLGT